MYYIKGLGLLKNIRCRWNIW